MTSIGIKSLKLHGYHGVHPEEQVLGSKFLYHVEVSVPQIKGSSTDFIQETIDYTQLIEIIKEVNSKSAKLLEFLCQSISDKISTQFPEIEEITVEIEKLQAPISEEIGSVYVKNIWKKV